MTNISSFWLTVIFSSFACLITTLGGAVVLFFKQINQKVMSFILSFSAGIMIASSIFSLLIVGIENCKAMNINPAFICTFGVFFGVFFIVLMEFLIDKFLLKNKSLAHLVRGKLREPVMSTIAISLHNIPEGLCIGVAFAGASLAGSSSAIMGSIMLAVGIGIQNFPEGSSVSLPLLNAGLSKGKSFLMAFLSGVVEPVFAVIGFFWTDVVASILPFFLCFSAGTMIAVSCIELLPESLGENKNISTTGLGIGFCLMMFLDLIF